jgi:hypothetical protein
MTAPFKFSKFEIHLGNANFRQELIYEIILNSVVGEKSSYSWQPFFLIGTDHTCILGISIVFVPLLQIFNQSILDLFFKLIFNLCVQKHIRCLFVLEFSQIFNIRDTLWQWDTVLILLNGDLDALIVDASLRHFPFFERPKSDPVALEFNHFLDYGSQTLHCL